MLFTPNISFLGYRPEEFFGEIVFEVPGTYTIKVDVLGGSATVSGGIVYDVANDKYLIPNGVTLAGAGLTAVVVGAGGGASGPNGSDGGMGGGGGALSYVNNYGVPGDARGTLSAGDEFSIDVGEGGAGGPRIRGTSSSSLNGTAGGISRLVRISDSAKLLIGNGGSGGVHTNGTVAGGTSSGTIRDGGGDGGASGEHKGNNDGTGGGGAGGYSGNGGNGMDENQSSRKASNLGSGGGGAGGLVLFAASIGQPSASGGGGVALYGEGSNGTVTYDNSGQLSSAATQGSLNVAPATAVVAAQINGGGRGIGAGGGGVEDDFVSPGGTGGHGGVRIVFGGASNPRSFPNTNVAQSGSLGNVVTVTGAGGAGDYGGYSADGT